MLLLSLRARILANRTDTGSGLAGIFGFYVRLDRGAFTNPGLSISEDREAQLAAQIRETFSQEFFLVVLESLFSEVLWCSENKKLDIDGSAERSLVKAAKFEVRYSESSIPEPSSIAEILLFFADLRRRVAEFIRRRFIYQEAATCPLASLDLPAVKRIVSAVRTAIPELNRAQFTLLLDEFENLSQYQQELINYIVKMAPPGFSVKIARKVGTSQTSRTLTGQDLQAQNDYNLIPLVYAVDDEDGEFGRYLALLESIVTKLLLSEGLEAIRLVDLLPETDEKEVDQAELDAEVCRLAHVEPGSFVSMPVAKKTEKRSYYGEAAIYRILGRRRSGKKKRFAGARTLGFLSSGIIRHFQEMLALAYFMAWRDAGETVCVIPPDVQTRAVHLVSEYYLANLSRNVAGYGDVLKYLLIDIGDILREKLLRHSSEPEAGRLAISNPEVLNNSGFGLVDEILTVGEREGVFHFSGSGGMRPKHANEPRPKEIVVSRIYAPVLEFSTRYRWRTTIHASDLRGLLTPEQRSATKSKLIRRVSKGPRTDGGQTNLPYKEKG